MDFAGPFTGRVFFFCCRCTLKVALNTTNVYNYTFQNYLCLMKSLPDMAFSYNLFPILALNFLLRNFLSFYGVKHIASAPFQPAMNGAV